MLYFILGIFFILLVIPLVENFVTIIASKTELITYKIAKQICDLKKQMDEQEEQEQHQVGFRTECVGYEIPPQSDDQYEEGE